MNNIQILDCTLRDGGYINNWNFGASIINKILTRLTQADVDIIECGFVSDVIYDKEYSLFADTRQINEVFNMQGKKPMYVGMIALEKNEIDSSKVPLCAEDTFGGIRLTFRKKEIERAMEYARDLMKKGYKVFIQPVGTMFYTDIELLQLIKLVNELNAYAFYIVDTLGSMSASDLTRMFYLIDHNLKEDICIGFHSHNNLQLSFSNAQELMKIPTMRNVIIDSSVFGMGRGAGNLCTELIAEHINTVREYKYDCVKLFSIIDSCLLPIKEKLDWGYSAAYYIAASKNCHPDYASCLLAKQTLRSADIDRILTMIPKETSYLFNQNLIDDLYLAYQENAVDDTQIRAKLRKELEEKDVLLIAPGRSILKAEAEIAAIMKQPNVVSMTVNFLELLQPDFVFVSNKKREENILLQNSKTQAIYTSNVSSLSIEKHVLNYTTLLNKNEITFDNAGLLAIEFLKQMGVSSICLAGFDGFALSGASDTNYYDEVKKTASDECILKKMNAEIKKSLCYYAKQMDLTFITPSVYNIKE